MPKPLSHWFFHRGGIPGWSAVRAACAERGWTVKATHERDGFVVEAPASPLGWRLEWGPSQRPYLGSHELRLRGDTGIDPQTFALLMPGSLMDLLERELYAQFTDSVQTRLDDSTPEEMRWLAMAERLSPQDSGPLRAGFAAVGNVTPWMSDWLAGPLGEALLAWAETSRDQPGPGAATGTAPALPLMALILRRGQLVLRLAMRQPAPERLAQAVAFFEVALAQTRRFAGVADAG